MLSPLKYLIIFGMTTLLITACGEENSGETNALEHAKKHLDPKYVCPMHSQIIRDEPGKCPICGMTLVKKDIQVKKPTPQAQGKKKILYWVAPMDPSYRRDEPGKSPMGMDLVPVYANDVTQPSESGDLPTVRLSPTVVNNLGVRTAKVQQGSIARQINTVGYVTYDEDKLIHVHSRAEGWVEKLMVRNEGDHIEANQVLLEMYAPAILAAQVDVLISLQSARAAGIRSEKHRDNARNRLRLFNVPDYVIKQIEISGSPRNTVPILSPQQGVVAKLNIREGMYVTPNLEMFTIADLASVWVLVEVFEHQLAWIKPHLNAEIRVAAHPQKIWKGVVDYLYPELDPKTRTLKVRLRFANTEGLLKPNMFAQATIYDEPKKNILKIKREALIVTGERTSVIVALGKGQFKPVDVLTGIQEGDEVEILAGLKGNHSVVISGQFLIDSESNLQASFQRLTAD